MGLELLEATRDTDVLVTQEFGIALVIGAIQSNDLRTLIVNPAHLSPTQEFPSAATPPAPTWFPFEAWYNRFSYRLVRRVVWLLLGKSRNNLNQKHLGTPKNTYIEFQSILADAPTLTIVSPRVLQRPTDWPGHFQITGYLFDDDSDWTPPQELTDFLAAGDAPVYIGFGSMSDHKPEASTRMIVEAVQQAGKRAVILSGWARLGASDLPETIYLLKYVPHHWLFPQMATVVHHGGAGTTAAGLRAGVPTIIVPHSGDQPYWGRRVKELGVGTAPIPRKKLTAEKLAAAITEATSSRTMQEKAAALGRLIAAEDGLGKTVATVETLLERF